MIRRGAFCALAALLALLAVASAQSCTGGSNRVECGANWAANNPFLPSRTCATCSTGGCTCPQSSCMQVLSACLASPGLVSYQVSFAGCKGSGSAGASAYASNIDWVAFQGVNGDGNGYAIQSAMNPSQNLYTFANTTACDNIYNKDSASTCCLQRNLNGNGQINTFTVPCGTRPVAWMKDSTFRSCVQPGNFPDYLTATEGPNQCSGSGSSTSQLCGPYYLPQQTCEDLPPCTPNAEVSTVVVTNDYWSEYSATCRPGYICRYARNPCETDSYWDAFCNCPTYNPIRVGYCQYSWVSTGFSTTAVCSCGSGDYIILLPGVIYPRPPWWNNYWCNGRYCTSWRPSCRRPPCRPHCNYWSCPYFPGGVRPPITPCRRSGCPGFPGVKPPSCVGSACITGPSKPDQCRGRHCLQICPKGSNTCPGFNFKPPTNRPGGGFLRPTVKPITPTVKPITPTVKPITPTVTPDSKPIAPTAKPVIPSIIPTTPLDRPSFGRPTQRPTLKPTNTIMPTTTSQPTTTTTTSQPTIITPPTNAVQPSVTTKRRYRPVADVAPVPQLPTSLQLPGSTSAPRFDRFDRAGSSGSSGRCSPWPACAAGPSSKGRIGH